MDLLPEDLENIIIDYKNQIENSLKNKAINHLINMSQKYDNEDFYVSFNGEYPFFNKYKEEYSIRLSYKMSYIHMDAWNFFNNVCKQKYSIQLELNEIVDILFTNINPDNINWYLIGDDDKDDSVQLNDLPISFLRKYRDRIYWMRLYQFIYKLPIEFVREFKDNINWGCYDNKSLYKFPPDFIREFKDKLIK